MVTAQANSWNLTMKKQNLAQRIGNGMMDYLFGKDIYERYLRRDRMRGEWMTNEHHSDVNEADRRYVIKRMIGSSALPNILGAACIGLSAYSQSPVYLAILPAVESARIFYRFLARKEDEWADKCEANLYREITQAQETEEFEKYESETWKIIDELRKQTEEFGRESGKYDLERDEEGEEWKRN